MMNFGYFETEMQVRYPDSLLVIRNMCDGGNTPGFRPHSSRKSPWAFPGADQFQTDLANKSGSTGHFMSPDEWLTHLKADVIIAFFGYNESFQGLVGLENYKSEFTAFIQHSLKQNYNGVEPPQLAVVSPIAFEDLSAKMDLPNGIQENINLKMYSEAMQEIADSMNVLFVDAFSASKEWYEHEDADLTADGFQLNDLGNQKFAKLLADRVFSSRSKQVLKNASNVVEAVREKNWFWHNDFKIPNGVHAYGRRYKPFGPDNYPEEIEKIREMTLIRDSAIWAAAKGEEFDLEAADQKTRVLPKVETNYTESYKNGDPGYLYGDESLAKISVANGYKVELFASEKEFNDLANPVQLSFDNRGRLWVGVMPSYPHYKPGDQKPNDKLIILEDKNQDGKADSQIIFADNLHLVQGFEFAPEGVYVSQGTNLVLLQDTDGDDRADVKEIILSGFDDHDTHHAFSAFCADPSGAIYMGEGTFHHSNIETAYGPVRGTNGGFFRYNPQRRHLERTAQLPIPNPWGIAFDDWGQNFFLHTSGPNMTWMLPGTIKPKYGEASPNGENLIQHEHRVRPTSGLEILSSSHFPDEVQGDILLCNTIGFLGIKQHKIVDDPESAGYLSTFRKDLLSSTDKNFRPVDLEFAPDGSLYIVDWHNVLIGHMQHNARDPLRDHVHGRIYRITYPSRPLVKPAKIDGATIEELLDNLKLPEYRTRYRSRRELRAKNSSEVIQKLKTWLETQDASNPNYEHHRLEALWVTWGLNKINQSLLRELLSSYDFRVRAAAVRVLRYGGHQIDNQPELLMAAAQDEHPRVRLEAMVAATWLDNEIGLPIVLEIGKQKLDKWMEKPYLTALDRLVGNQTKKMEPEDIVIDLKGDDRDAYIKGKEIYEEEGYCITCHQADGNGLPASGFPPLKNSLWVGGEDMASKERLIKLTLKGLLGPIEVNGVKYPGQVPMTPFEGLLDDVEIAAVLTFIRHEYAGSSAISPLTVKQVHEAIKDKKGFYSPEELLKIHPLTQ